MARADAVLDAHAFALAHAAEDRHDHVVGLAAGIDPAPDFWDPEADAVVHEDREGEAELVAVEGPVRLADDDGVEPALGVPEVIEEPGRLGSTLPRDRPTVADVEVVGHDLPAGRLDELAGQRELPHPRRLGVLLILGAHPAVEGEARHAR
jgi:hypothetical protein